MPHSDTMVAAADPAGSARAAGGEGNSRQGITEPPLSARRALSIALVRPPAWRLALRGGPIEEAAFQLLQLVEWDGLRYLEGMTPFRSR